MSLIKRLEELEAKATPGPWIYGHYDSNASIGQKVHGLIKWNVAESKIKSIEDEETGEVVCFEWQGPVNTKDAILIVEMRNSITKLLDLVKAVQDNLTIETPAEVLKALATLEEDV